MGYQTISFSSDFCFQENSILRIVPFNEVLYNSDGVKWIEVGGNPSPPLPYFLMLYTGLKDKNGGEIYEGDILNEYLDSDRLFWKGPVKWNARKAGFYLFIDHSQEGIGIQIDRTVVIGNIHENPEFLKS